MFGVSFFICGFLCLVESQNQYQHIQSYPFGSNYASIYGSQPVIVQPSTYNQVYNQVPYRSPYPESFPVTNQLQEIYLKKILSNPTIQALIDPGTRIYNQNGLEISDQIRPVTPNVVNNYFIVPTDYLKINDSKANSKNIRYTNRNNYYSHPKRYLNNENVKDTEQRKNDGYKYRQNVRERKNCRKNVLEYRGREVTKKHILHDTGEVIDNLSATNNKKKCNVKRQDSSKSDRDSQNQTIDNSDMSEKNLGTKKRSQKINTNHRRSKVDKKIKLESDKCKGNELFDINDECCDLDNRNIRNSASDTQNNKNCTNSTKKQNDLMNNWMNYVKMFMPDQNIDSLDFSNFNFPYNFEQMYQMPNLYNMKPQIIKSDKKDKEGKQKIQTAKSVSKVSDGNNNTDNYKSTVVELSPKFIEIESPLISSEKTNKVTNLTSETKLEKSKKKQTQEIERNPVYEQSAEEVPMANQNDIIDYYPNFTNDAKYTTDENDLYFFHNRHYYNADDAINREIQTLHRDNENLKWSENVRDNDISSFKKRKMKEKTEDNQFRTPPGLKEPGFQTKKIDTKNRADCYSFYIDDTDRPEFRPLEKDNNNVETVFARSKVVNYGKPIEFEKLKSNSNQSNRNERERNPYSKDGDTTIVFSKAWNS